MTFDKTKAEKSITTLISESEAVWFKNGHTMMQSLHTTTPQAFFYFFFVAYFIYIV